MTTAGVGPVVIEEVDGTRASDDVLRARWEVHCEVDAELRPHVPPISFEANATSIRNPLPNEVNRRWVVWSADRSRAVASAYLGYTTGPTNQHLAWADLAVRPEARRQGIGQQLLRVIGDQVRDAGRTTLLLDAKASSDGSAFLAKRGFECKQTVRLSRMVLADVDRTMLEQWVERAAERASGYSLRWLDDDIPDEDVQAYVKVNMVINTAPRDDLDMEDWVDTPEEFRARQALQREQGWTVFRVVAVEDATGDFVGYTNVYFAPWTPGVGHQGGTAVDPTHRNRGLGRWLKAATALRILDQRPDVDFVDTDNAESNDAMLAINVAMGFRELYVEETWQGRVDEVLGRLG